MNKPTYTVTGIEQCLGIGNNREVTFQIYESNPPMVDGYYYAQVLDSGVYVTKVSKFEG